MRNYYKAFENLITWLLHHVDTMKYETIVFKKKLIHACRLPIFQENKKVDHKSDYSSLIDRFLEVSDKLKGLKLLLNN